MDSIVKYSVTTARGVDRLEKTLNSAHLAGEEIVNIFSGNNGEFVVVTKAVKQTRAPTEGRQYGYNYDENSEIPTID